MMKVLKDERGGIPIAVIIAIFLSVAGISGWTGFKLAGGTVYAVVIAVVVGFAFGLVLLPSVVSGVKWMRKEIGGDGRKMDDRDGG